MYGGTELSQWELKMVPLWKTTGGFSQCQIFPLHTYDTMILLLGIYPNKKKTFIHTNIRQMLIAKTGNNQNIPLLKNGQTVVHPHTGNTILQCKGTISKCSNMDESQMHFSKRKKQTQNAIKHMTPFI